MSALAPRPSSVQRRHSCRLRLAHIRYDLEPPTIAHPAPKPSQAPPAAAAVCWSTWGWRRRRPPSVPAGMATRHTMRRPDTKLDAAHASHNSWCWCLPPRTAGHLQSVMAVLASGGIRLGWGSALALGFVHVSLLHVNPLAFVLTRITRHHDYPRDRSVDDTTIRPPYTSPANMSTQRPHLFEWRRPTSVFCHSFPHLFERRCAHVRQATVGLRLNVRNAFQQACEEDTSGARGGIVRCQG